MKRRAERHTVIGTGVATSAPGRQLLMQYLGYLGLLARCSIALRDAEAMGLIRWRRVLDRIEVEPA